jgi:hypothetical protein
MKKSFGSAKNSGTGGHGAATASEPNPNRRRARTISRRGESSEQKLTPDFRGGAPSRLCSLQVIHQPRGFRRVRRLRERAVGRNGASC